MKYLKRKNYKRKQNNYQDRLNSNKTNTFNLERLIKVSAVLCMIQTLNDLKSRYCSINTGNLVIDSFVSNLKEVADKYHITLDTSIKLSTTQIPLTDYDLTIVLGNLFDNAITACNDVENAVITVKLQTIRNTFTIYVENSYNASKKHSSDNDFDFIHGYGLKNVKNSVEKYNGFCIIDPQNCLYAVTCIIPLNQII